MGVNDELKNGRRVMFDWFGISIFCVGFALIYEGVARGVQKINDRTTKFLIGTGVLIFLVGAGLSYQSAQALEKLSATLTMPKLLSRDRLELESVAAPQRIKISAKLAREAFINGEEEVKIFTEQGQWVPFNPSVNDYIARETHLKKDAEIKERKKNIGTNAMAAEQEAKRWLVGLLISVFTGFLGGLYYRRQQHEVA